MTKTALETTTEALRLIGVAAVSEAAEAEDHARAEAHLAAIYEELDETDGLALEWTTAAVPDSIWPHLAEMVAARICTAYGKPQFKALGRPARMEIRKIELGDELQVETPVTFF